METMLIDVEGIINSRPLTYLYDDDIPEPLTPSHLLAGPNISIKSGEITLTSVMSAETLGKRAKYMQRIMQMFWNRFKYFYLSELREHHIYRNNQNKTNDDNISKIGDIVAIRDDKIIPRSS